MCSTYNKSVSLIAGIFNALSLPATRHAISGAISVPFAALALFLGANLFTAHAHAWSGSGGSLPFCCKSLDSETNFICEGENVEIIANQIDAPVFFNMETPEDPDPPAPMACREESIYTDQKYCEVLEDDGDKRTKCTPEELEANLDYCEVVDAKVGGVDVDPDNNCAPTRSGTFNLVQQVPDFTDPETDTDCLTALELIPGVYTLYGCEVPDLKPNDPPPVFYWTYEWVSDDDPENPFCVDEETGEVIPPENCGVKAGFPSEKLPDQDFFLLGPDDRYFLFTLLAYTDDGVEKTATYEQKVCHSGIDGYNMGDPTTPDGIICLDKRSKVAITSEATLEFTNIESEATNTINGDQTCTNCADPWDFLSFTVMNDDEEEVVVDPLRILNPGENPDPIATVYMRRLGAEFDQVQMVIKGFNTGFRNNDTAPDLRLFLNREKVLEALFGPGGTCVEEATTVRLEGILDGDPADRWQSFTTLNVNCK